MQWQDQGIVLHRRILGEDAWIVTLLTKEHGLHKGVLKIGRRGPRWRSSKTIPATGDLVSALWTARLAEQLGSWSLDLERAIPPLVLRDPARLRGLMVFGDLLSRILTERTPCPEIFAEAEKFLEQLKEPIEETSWVRSYLLLELIILEKVGFGLDFRDADQATSDDPLTYVSPRTGRVVTRSRGEPYRDRLLVLPSFLSSETQQELPMRADFQFTAFFLHHRLSPESCASFYEARDLMIRTLVLRS